MIESKLISRVFEATLLAKMIIPLIDKGEWKGKFAWGNRMIKSTLEMFLLR